MTNRLLQIIKRKQSGQVVSQDESSDIKGLINTLVQYFPRELDECTAELSHAAIERVRALEKHGRETLVEELTKLRSQLDAAAKKEHDREIEAMYKRDIEKSSLVSCQAQAPQRSLSSRDRYEMIKQGYGYPKF